MSETTSHTNRPATAEEELLDALHPDRARHDELGRTRSGESETAQEHASPREQAAAPIDLERVDE